MTSPAAHKESSSPRVLVLDDDKPHDVFDVLAIDGLVVRVRSPFLFEIGEELSIRIEQDGSTTDAIAKVRAHVGPADGRITELEITRPTSPDPQAGEP